MEMLQDYEKDTRLSATSYQGFLMEVLDDALGDILAKGAEESIKSHKRVTRLLIELGEKP